MAASSVVLLRSLSSMVFCGGTLVVVFTGIGPGLQGIALQPALTWLIRPSLLASVNIPARLMSWRVMISLSGLVPFVLLSCFNFLRDSPRVLLYRWKFALANDVLSVMYAINHGDFYTNFNKKKSDKHQTLEDCVEVDLGPDWIYIDNFPYLFIKIFQTIRKIFVWRFIRRFFPALVVSSTMFLSIFMAILWAVKMTRNVELSTNINSPWEGCYLNALDVLHIDPQFNPCFHTISTRVLMELLAGFSAVILGKIILLLIGVVKIGRKVALGSLDQLVDKF
uniref:Uncharacterized protein n=1 Tax=Timema poppense TaxID=170557 RepID=A0A7R9HCT6_TIMPO|nr:unnamed protein product [Timema poppensis]